MSASASAGRVPGQAALIEERPFRRGIDEQELQRRELQAHVAREARNGRIIAAGRLITLVVFLGGWYWASGRIVDRLFVSDPVRVVQALWRIIGNGQLPYHIQFTLTETLAGYAIGAVLGLIAAWIVSLSASFQKIVHPFLIGFYAIPKIALAPLMIMWFGLEMTPKIVIAAIFVFFVVFMNTLGGIQTVSPSLVNVARVMGLNNYQLMTKIVYPSAVPNITMALRITVPEAMIGAIIGEFIAGNRGVGYLINSASNQYNTAGVFAGICALLVVVLTMDWLVTVLERRLMKWRSVSSAHH
jgi:NitT/TauT family transport system permease protein